jgi:hypothetical protein
MALRDLVRGEDALLRVVRRHADVDDRDVGTVVFDLAQDLVAARGLRHDVDPRIVAQQRDDTPRTSMLSSVITARTAAPR